MADVEVVTTRAALRSRRRQLSTTDQVVVEGFVVDGRSGASVAPVTCVGVVSSRESARAALLAGVSGASLVVLVEGDAAMRLAFLEDVERLVDRPATSGGDRAPLQTHLDDDDQILLVHLARGATVGAASARAGISARTAHRRLAALRCRFGASSTGELLTVLSDRLETVTDERTDDLGLLGRDHEVRTCEAALAAGGSVIVSGPAGIGKSAILQALADRDARRCHRGGGLRALMWKPYLPLSRAVGPLPSGADAAAVVHLSAQRTAGGLLVLDDLHWSDTATLAVLVQLVRRQPVLVATRDTGDRAGQVLDALTSAGARLVELTGLGDGAAATLVDRRRPELPTEARAAIVRRAEGNPLRLIEAIAGPNPTLEARVAAALRDLQPAGRDDLARLALLGRPADDHLVGSSLTELVTSGLVLVDGETVELRHELIGEEVLAAASEDEIREHHRFLADRLPAAEAAHHHAAAGDPAAARSAAIEAAEETEHPGATARLLVLAATCLPPETDADPVEQTDLLLRAVDAFTESGELDDARSTLERLPAAQDSAAALLRTARLDWRQGRPEAARAAVDAGLALAAGSETPEEVALRIEQLRFPIRVDFDATRAVELGRSTVALARRLGCEEARARTLLGSALLIDGSSEWSKEISLGMELAARTSDIDAEMEAANAMTAAHLLGGDRVEAREVATRAWQAARSAHRRAWEEQFGVLANFLALIAGDLTAVTEWGRREVGPHLNAAVHLAYGTYAIALADVGRPSAALSTLREGLALEIGDATGPSLLRWAEAEAHWLLGQTAPALAAAERSLSCAVPGFPVRPLAAAIRAWCQYDSGRPVTEAEEDGWDFARAAAVESRGVALLAANEPTEAARHFQAAAELAADAPRFALRARWALGESWRLAGEPGPALAVLRTAHDDAARAGFMALHGRCHRSLRQLGSPEHNDDRAEADDPPLTGRQREVLRLVARGHTTREIASILGVRPATVDTHVGDAMRRLGAVTRRQAALLVGGCPDESSDPGDSS